MPKIDSLEMLLVNELRDILDAEQRITKAIPKMVKASESADIQAALNGHLSETEAQITRLEKCFRLLEVPTKAKACHGMRGIIDEGSEHMKEDYSDPAIRDAAIIAAAQKVEHYEISAYGTAVSIAKLLGHMDVASFLEDSLEEEKAADKELSRIAESMVNPDAATTYGEKDTRNHRSASKTMRRPARSVRRSRPRAPVYKE